jgi:hypothetical protein
MLTDGGRGGTWNLPLAPLEEVKRRMRRKIKDMNEQLT